MLSLFLGEANIFSPWCEQKVMTDLKWIFSVKNPATSSNVTLACSLTWWFTCGVVTVQDFSWGRAAVTDLPPARVTAVLQFMLQDIAITHPELSVNIFHLTETSLCWTKQFHFFFFFCRKGWENTCKSEWKFSSPLFILSLFFFFFLFPTRNLFFLH